MHLDRILFGRGGDDDDGDDDGDNNVKSQNDTGIRRNKTHEDGDEDGDW